MSMATDMLPAAGSSARSGREKAAGGRKGDGVLRLWLVCGYSRDSRDVLLDENEEVVVA